jgi:hypothetical protein
MNNPTGADGLSPYHQHDYIPVRRDILLRLLDHIRSGHMRFPTRHLLQAILMLQHMLGLKD